MQYQFKDCRKLLNKIHNLQCLFISDSCPEEYFHQLQEHQSTMIEALSTKLAMLEDSLNCENQASTNGNAAKLEAIN